MSMYPWFNQLKWVCQITVLNIILTMSLNCKSTQYKNHFLSLVGLSPEETHTILKKVQKSDYEGLVELNLSCPNVPGKPQIAYDFETTTDILTEVFSYFTKPLGVKLPPYFDIVHFDQAAAVFNQFPLVFVNCVNSIGNGLYIEDESVVIKPKMASVVLVVIILNLLLWQTSMPSTNV